MCLRSATLLRTMNSTIIMFVCCLFAYTFVRLLFVCLYICLSVCYSFCLFIFYICLFNFPLCLFVKYIHQAVHYPNSLPAESYPLNVNPPPLSQKYEMCCDMLDLYTDIANIYSQQAYDDESYSCVILQHLNTQEVIRNIRPPGKSRGRCL